MDRIPFARIEGSLLILQRGSWRSVQPVESLGRWLSFYRRLRDRDGTAGQPGPWARFYQDAVRDLEAVAATLRARS